MIFLNKLYKDLFRIIAMQYFLVTWLLFLQDEIRRISDTQECRAKMSPASVYVGNDVIQTLDKQLNKWYLMEICIRTSNEIFKNIIFELQIGRYSISITKQKNILKIFFMPTTLRGIANRVFCAFLKEMTSQIQCQRKSSSR